MKLTSSYKTLTDKLFGDDKPDTKSMELLCRSFIETPEQLNDYNYESLNRPYTNAKSNDKDSEIISDIIILKKADYKLCCQLAYSGAQKKWPLCKKSEPLCKKMTPCAKKMSLGIKNFP